MPFCNWCPPEQQQEAVAQLPLADKEIKGGRKIFVCAKHKKWADEHLWYVESLEDQALGADALMRRIDAKHLRIRGTMDLKFKPKDWPRAKQQRGTREQR